MVEQFFFRQCGKEFGLRPRGSAQIPPPITAYSLTNPILEHFPYQCMFSFSCCHTLIRIQGYTPRFSGWGAPLVGMLASHLVQNRDISAFRFYRKDSYFLPPWSGSGWARLAAGSVGPRPPFCFSSFSPCFPPSSGVHAKGFELNVGNHFWLKSFIDDT